MHIIINVLEQTGSGDLADTGITRETILLIILALTALIAGSALFCKMKSSAYNNLRANKLMSAGIIVPVLALVISGLSPVAPVNAAMPTSVATGDTVTMTVYQGESASQQANININGIFGSTDIGYQVLGQLQSELDEGISLELDKNALNNVTSTKLLEDGTANLTKTPELTLVTTPDVPAGTYEYDLNLNSVLVDYCAVTLPNAITSRIAGNISVDNVNFFDAVCNYAGGDLIIKAPAGETYSASSTITLGASSIPCTTTGEKYTSNNEIGCVIPKTGLADGTLYDIFVDNGAGPELVGELNYSSLPSAFSACTTMQTFASAGCKATLSQGQSLLLEDNRNGADGNVGYGKTNGHTNYRVKKMPDGNVWMIDNLAYTPQSGADYNATTGIDDLTVGSTGSVNTKAQFYRLNESVTYLSNPEYGYLYNWCATVADTSVGCVASANSTNDEFKKVQGIAPLGWKIPEGNINGNFNWLNSYMISAAANNPVYNSNDGGDYGQNPENWIAPFSRVMSGEYQNTISSQGSECIFYTSSSDRSGPYSIYIDATYNFPVTNSGDDSAYSVRGVL